MDQFQVILKAIFDKSGIKTGIDEISKIVQSMPVEVKAKLETQQLKGDLKTFSQEITSILNKNYGFKLNTKQVESALGGIITKSKSVVSELSRMNKASSLKTWADNNTKAMKKYGTEIKAIIAEYKNLGTQMSKSRSDELMTRVKEIQTIAPKGLTALDKLKNAWAKFGGWSIASGLFVQGVRTVKAMVSNVVKLDSAMTNLYKVTDETDAKYSKFLSSARDNAKELGRSISSLVKQTSKWAKLGFNLDDSSSLAQISSMYANVGEVDDDTAVSDIVTAMKAFNIEASNSISIVDRLNALGNKYATSSADLGTGLSKSASALALAGNDIDQSLAMITAMTEVTQDASESGNALKVLSMRLRGASTDLSNYGEDTDGVIESTSKLQEKIEALTNTTGAGGFNILTDSGNFKSTYEIMQGISAVWSDISNVNQAALLETIAGKQRGNSVSALLTNMSQANNAYTDSVNSAGSAQAEQDKWMQSIEAKTQQFEASFQSLSSTIFNSDLIKWFVDFGTGAVSALDGITKAITTLGTLSLVGGITAFIKNLDWLNRAAKNLA